MYKSLWIFLALWSSVYAQKAASEQTGSWSLEAFEDIQPWELPNRLSPKEARALSRIPATAWAEREWIVVLGFWCSDSEAWIPVWLKGLEKIPQIQVKVIALDRQKQGGADWNNSLNITHLPTFIVLEKGNEIGRIVETPASGILWKDLGDLLKNR